MSKRIVLLACCVLASIAGAQSFTTALPGSFVDISTTGGTAIIGVTDDSNHAILTTLGNTLFPAGNQTVCNNGCVVGGSAAAGTTYINATIGASGLPVGLSGGNVALCPFWDDLYPETGATNTTIYWQESAGVLYIMWKNDNHFSDATVGNGITFEIQVFSSVPSCASPYIQYLYTDTVFGGVNAATADNALSATIGYATTIAGLGNALYSFNTTQAGLTAAPLSVVYQPFVFAASSPCGAGDIQLNISDCSGASPAYFMPFTLAAGLYPNGWLYGLDIPLTDAVNLWTSGFPFVGPLPIQIGPFGCFALPSGLQFWAVAVGLNGTLTPNGKSAKLTYVIP